MSPNAALRRVSAARVDQVLALVLLVGAELQCVLVSDALSGGWRGALMMTARW